MDCREKKNISKVHNEIKCISGNYLYAYFWLIFWGISIVKYLGRKKYPPIFENTRLTCSFMFL